MKKGSDSDLVQLVIECTKDQAFGQRKLRAGDVLPMQPPVPRWFALRCIRHCSTGFRMSIREMD